MHAVCSAAELYGSARLRKKAFCAARRRNAEQIISLLSSSLSGSPFSFSPAFLFGDGAWKKDSVRGTCHVAARAAEKKLTFPRREVRTEKMQSFKINVNFRCRRREIASNHSNDEMRRSSNRELCARKNKPIACPRRVVPLKKRDPAFRPLHICALHFSSVLDFFRIWKAPETSAFRRHFVISRRHYGGSKSALSPYLRAPIDG